MNRLVNLSGTAALIALLGCSSGNLANEGGAGGHGIGGGPGGGAGTGPDGGLGGIPGGGGNAGGTAGAGGGSASGCGDHVLAANEACDDGNQVGGDGCSADCLQVQPGYSCVPAGQPCHPIARCGDGITIPPEQCDDHNLTAGDGCSPTCKIEIGFKCSGSPSTCSGTTCGDGLREGAESCEDSNSLPWDGCSSDCQIEPDCSGSFGCTSRCGDGLVIGEECDDGNRVSGDGCSATCQVEQGFTCTQPPLGDRIQVPVVYRDFRYHNPADFEPAASGLNSAKTGMVQSTLDASGKPVFTGIANSLVTSAASFNTWYRDVPGTNFTVARKLTLWKNDNGDFENRWGPNGEKWQRVVTAIWCGSSGYEKKDAAGAIIPCTYNSGTTYCDTYLGQGMQMLKCTLSGGSYSATFLAEEMAGTPVFFPIDDVPFTPSSEREYAMIPPLYGDNSSGAWFAETGQPLHNFSFTSEIRTWFLYDDTRTYTLQFTGDDDVWFFINRQLAVDLGGIHTPVEGSVTITAANAATYGLSRGGVYEVAAFHAERQTEGSSFRLTISGFNTQPSDCKASVCGDGKLGIGEECDDGVNTGGYGKCGPGCKMDQYCGDGIVQPGYEDCDTLPVNGVTCPKSCRIL